MNHHLVEVMKELTGITWNHTRGYLPMVATAQRFSERHPEIVINWQKRSLQAFADAPLVELASRFDLLVIDHPSIGEAARHDLLLKLDQHLEPKFLADQAKNSVGQSHISYAVDGHHYALAIDAAAPISGYRADLLTRAGAEPPQTWSELLALAHRGLVTVPAIPIDSLMNLFMLVDALGDEPFTVPGFMFKPETGKEALQMLRELVNLCEPGSFARNPICTWQFLADSSRVAYCPFAYGYSNYSRHGYAANLLTVGGLISLSPSGTPLRSTLGGAGLAISKQCACPESALSYAQFVASPECQSTLYANSGGQPGHRVAWQDVALNVATNNFFANTLRTLDSAWLRPRFPGYIDFQNVASSIVHHYLCHGGPESTVLAKLNQSLQSAQRANL